MAVSTRLVRHWADHIKQQRWVFDDHVALGPLRRLDALLRAVLGEKPHENGSLTGTPLDAPFGGPESPAAPSGGSVSTIGVPASGLLQKNGPSGAVLGENSQTPTLPLETTFGGLKESQSSPKQTYPVFLGGRLPPGYAFILCNQSNSAIGADGYDDYQAPFGDEALFARRMWASGSMDYTGPEPQVGDAVQCVEKVLSVRQVQNSVFVRINRDFCTNRGPFLAEIRTLVYTNEKYSVSAREGGLREPLLADMLATGSDLQSAQDAAETGAKNALLGPRVRFSENQVLSFSMLSANLHKIHFDREHCRTEGLRGPVVQGSFLAAAGLAALGLVRPHQHVRLFKYTNRRPLYCGQQTALIGQLPQQRAWEVALADQNGPYISTSVHVEPGAGRLSG